MTDFADLATLLPLAAFGAVGLWLVGWRQGAIAWALAIGGTLATMLVFKLVFLAAPTGPGHVFSPSGHTAAAAAVYGGAGALWLRRRFPALSSLAAAALAAGGIIAVIGASRLLLHVHTLPEVGAGASVGFTFVLLLVRLAGSPPPGLRAGRVAAAALLVVILLHGKRLGAEPWLRGAAGWLPGSVCAALPPSPWR